MLCVRQRPALDYSKCNQTVTIYHKEEERYTRTVYPNAFLELKKNQTVDKLGSREGNSFLLVLPCKTLCVFVGDKVLLGVGAPIASRGEWAALIPATVPQLVVVKQVDPKYWNGQLVHVEAGG